MIFTYSFTINGYDVTVTIEFFPHIIVLEDSSPELTDDESKNIDISLKLLSRTFCDKGQKCENDPNLPLGSLEVFVYGESSPKFTMYKKTKG